MFKQIKYLTDVQLKNYFGINELKYSKDKTKKNRLIGMIVAWVIVLLMCIFYVGALSYGYVYIGVADVLPMYLVTIISLVILFFSMFKAGSIIFQTNSYDMLCTLPVRQSSIVISRFLRMYFGNVLLSLAIMVPGMAVYGYFLHPRFSFYLIGLFGTLFIPLVPIGIATIIGAFITAISSRMKHKSIVSALLSVIFIGVIVYASYSVPTDLQNVPVDMFQNYATSIIAVIGKIYPPAVWLGKAMLGGGLVNSLIYFGVSILVFIAMVIIVSVNFQGICRRLSSTVAKHDYKITAMKSQSAFMTLYKKELKRYFASSIYVTNTIVGPFLAVLMMVALLIAGVDKVQGALPAGFNILPFVPFVITMSMCIMSTTCTSVSLEGKNLWIIQNLPIKAKTVFDSKIMVNLTVYGPFYLIAAILAVIAFKPGFIEALWIFVIPLVFLLFSCVLGITTNLKFPVFDWENEVTVVKQSTSSLVGGLGGSIVIIIMALPLLFFPQVPLNIMRLIICVIVAVVTAILYNKNAKTNLETLGD